MTTYKDRDILISPTSFIPWVSFDPTNQELYEIDTVLDRYPEFWNALEIDCVAGCCGLDAFRFLPEDITHAATTIDKTALKKDLLEQRQELIQAQATIVSSGRLNNLMDKGVYIQLLEHITNCL